MGVGGVVAFGVVARSVGVLDDVLQGVGFRPHTEPDPRDVSLLAAAAAGQRRLLALLDATSTEDFDADVAALRDVLTEQLTAVSDPESDAAATAAPLDAPSDLDASALADEIDDTAQTRASDALSAGSLDVMKVLAGISAGLEQVAVAVRGGA